MGAPGSWSGPLPGLFTKSYLKRQIGTGNLYVGSYTAPGGGGTVRRTRCTRRSLEVTVPSLSKTPDAAGSTTSASSAVLV